MKDGWEMKKLGDIAKVIGGYSFKSGDFLRQGKYQVLRMGNIRPGIVRENERPVFIDNLDETILKKALLITDDVIITQTGTKNKRDYGFTVIIDKNNYLLNQRISAIRFFKNYLPKFFLYYSWTNSFKDQYFANETGTVGQGNVGIKAITEAIVPYISIKEQKRIVAILDKAFAAIDKAKANAEQNLKNAKELFESYLQGVFENKGEEWEEKKFDEICVLQRGFDLPKRLRNKGVFPLVSSNGITDMIDQWKVKSPGVTTGRSGTIGNVYFIEKDYWPLNTALYIKEFYGNYERYIYYFLRQFDLRKYSSGSGVPTLNRNNVHGEIVRFPKSLIMQQTIVKKLDVLSAETKKLEAIYQQKIDDLEELKKSILQKAFNGEL